MKHILSKLRFLVILPLITCAVCLTLPGATTAGKYVWQEDVNITLQVNYTPPASADATDTEGQASPPEPSENEDTPSLTGPSAENGGLSSNNHPPVSETPSTDAETTAPSTGDDAASSANVSGAPHDDPSAAGIIENE